MTDTPAPDGIQAQVLIELGKLSTSHAVANTKLDQLLHQGNDHEQRIREGERERAELRSILDSIRGERDKMRDVSARALSMVAVGAAVAAVVIPFFHH